MNMLDFKQRQRVIEIKPTSLCEYTKNAPRNIFRNKLHGAILGHIKRFAYILLLLLSVQSCDMTNETDSSKKKDINSKNDSEKDVTRSIERLKVTSEQFTQSA